MEIIARKTKDFQTKTLIGAIILFCLSCAVLITEIACASVLGWRGAVDVVYLLLMSSAFAFFAWEFFQFIQMVKVPEEIVTYEEGKFTFSDMLTCECAEVERLTYKCAGEKEEKSWGTLYFYLKGKLYSCPLIEDVKYVYEHMLALGAKSKLTYTQDLAVAQETAEVEEVAEAEETVETEEVAEAEETAETEEVAEAEETAETEEVAEAEENKAE